MKSVLLKMAAVFFTAACAVSTNAQQQQQNELYAALNSYIETLVAERRESPFVISKEKLASNETLRVFKISFDDFFDGDKKRIEKGTIYNEKAFAKMEQQYANNCTKGRWSFCADAFWSEADFNNKNIVFEVMSIPNNIAVVGKKYNYKLQIYSFSEPIYYKNKKHVIFLVIEESLFSPGMRYVVMSKKKGKWLATHSGGDPYVIN